MGPENTVLFIRECLNLDSLPIEKEVEGPSVIKFDGEQGEQ